MGEFKGTPFSSGTGLPTCQIVPSERRPKFLLAGLSVNPGLQPAPGLSTVQTVGMPDVDPGASGQKVYAPSRPSQQFGSPILLARCVSIQPPSQPYRPVRSEVIGALNLSPSDLTGPLVAASSRSPWIRELLIATRIANDQSLFIFRSDPATKRYCRSPPSNRRSGRPSIRPRHVSMHPLRMQMVLNFGSHMTE